MILFLSSKKNMNILDFLIDSEGLFIKKYIGIFNLNEFLNNSINKLEHIETLFIDISALSDTKEKFIEIVSVFSKYKNVKLGFYMENRNMETINDLISLNIFNIVTKTEVEELKKELKMVFLGGMKESYTKEKFGMNLNIKLKPEYNFKEKEIIISITGTLNRIGTTTIAIGFANYLSALGAEVCYIETNKSEHLKLIADYYKMKSEDKRYSYNNFQLQKIGNKNNKKFNVIIYDLGILKERQIEGIKYSDISILVAGNKATEIEYLEKAKVELKEINYNTIINFSNGEDKGKIYYLNQVTEMFSYEENGKIYSKIIEKYFREINKNE